MKIAFLLCSPDINGGTYVIFEHASRLAGMGHEVSVITREYIQPARYEWHPEASCLEWEIITEIDNKTYDCAIATWWESPFLLHHIQARHFVYFVQSIESRFFPGEEQTDHDKRDHSVGSNRCDNSYFFSVPVITEATWIKEYLVDNYNSRVQLVRNGIRKDLYSESGNQLAARRVGKIRVLVEGPIDVFHKNVPHTIELCRMSNVSEIWLLTSSAITGFPGVDRVFSQVPIDRTPEIYRSCDVLVKLSYIEGMFGPPLEMFHCGGTALVHDVTGHDEYIVHDMNSLVVARDNDELVVTYLNRLCDEPELLDRLKAGAQKTAEGWPDWRDVSHQFEKALMTIRDEPPVSRNYLRRFSEHLDSHFSLQLQCRDLERFIAREQEGNDAPMTAHNFIQVYHHSGGTPPKEEFCWHYYRSGDKMQCSVAVPVSSFPLHLRVDPSVRIGIIRLSSIRILSSRTGAVLLDLRPEKGFSDIVVAGTCRWLHKTTTCWVLESFGNDPQFFLPGIIAEPGEKEMVVELTLQETGIFKYLQENKRPSLLTDFFPGLKSKWKNLISGRC
jgi:O-antigen biosynthesis protein